MVNRCGELEAWSTGADVGPAGSWRRGQQVPDVGQQVRRNVVNRCGETWSQAGSGDVVSRCGETWSAGATRRGQPVRRDVVSRCDETWSAGAGNAVSRCGKRGQPVRETRSTGAWNAVNRCGETLFSPMFSRFCEPCPIFPISPISPGKGRGKRAGGGVLAADAARRHRMLLHTGLSHR